MSTSVSRRSPAPVHPTRQQLEELDALLKRMLELPVDPLEDAAAEDAPSTATAQSEGSPAVSPPEPMRGPHRPALTQTAETAAPAVNYQTPDAEETDLNPRVVPAAPPQSTAENPPAAGDWIPLTSSWRPSARTWKPLSEAWRQAQTGTGAPPWRPRGCATFRRRCRRNRNSRRRAWKRRGWKRRPPRRNPTRWRRPPRRRRRRRDSARAR